MALGDGGDKCGIGLVDVVGNRDRADPRPLRPDLSEAFERVGDCRFYHRLGDFAFRMRLTASKQLPPSSAEPFLGKRLTAEDEDLDERGAGQERDLLEPEDEVERPRYCGTITSSRPRRCLSAIDRASSRATSFDSS